MISFLILPMQRCPAAPLTDVSAALAPAWRRPS